MTTVQRLDAILKSRGMSRRQAAIAAKIPPSTLQSAMERGKNISVDMLQSIANALEVPIGELLGMSDVDAFIAEFDEKTQAEFLNDELKRRLDRSLEKLSETGRMEAVKRVEEMTYIPDYQKQKTPPEAPQEAPEGE